MAPPSVGEDPVRTYGVRDAGGVGRPVNRWTWYAFLVAYGLLALAVVYGLIWLVALMGVTE
jgi:hypothetical protein